LRRDFRKEDCAEDYIAADLTAETIQTLNERHIFFGAAPFEAQAAFTNYMMSIGKDIERELGHPWTIVNVRAWTTLKSEDFGPTQWHVDGFSSFATKMMIYPLPMNHRNGTLELYDRQGKLHEMASEEPACILFDNAALLHRGRGGADRRPAIEVQTMPCDSTDIRYVFAGQNARTLRSFAPEIEAEIAASRHVRPSPRPAVAAAPRRRTWKSLVPVVIKQSVKSALSRIRGAAYGKNPTLNPTQYVPPRSESEIVNHAAFLNIGGGAQFNYPGWINLEEAVSELNPLSFRLSSDCVFPVRSASIQLIYSSHCLEHLDDATVARVLSEAGRVIARTGRLIIKVPDFDEVLRRWQSNDLAYFDQWGLQEIVGTWGASDVLDNIDTRASMVFCGFWNSHWGNHFGTGPRKVVEKAYHGPARLDRTQLHDLLATRNPRLISQVLVSHVMRNETDYSFNHRNAWSKDEFASLLRKSGFKVETDSDATSVVARHESIPDIRNMLSISAYYEATRAK
jgi:SAM-dependent methyltransferase